MVTTGGVAAGGCPTVPEGVYYGDDYVCYFDYFDGGDVEVAGLGGEEVCYYHYSLFCFAGGVVVGLDCLLTGGFL